MKSIRHTLLIWLSIGLTAGIATAAGVLYLRAQQESNQIFDYQMRQLAASLPSQPFAPLSPGRRDTPDVERDIVIQIWDGTGLNIYHSHEQHVLPERAQLGFATVNTPDGPWRVYSARQGSTVVQVAQPMSARRAVAADTALKTVMPLLLLFPFVGALVWVTVSQGLSPVKRVAREVQARDAGALTPIPDAGLPQEIQPLTHALNDLLARLDLALGAQRAFTADAAHELRTPLAALKLQIQLAERARDEAGRKAAFAELEQGFERTMRLVQQLLTLARQEPGAAPVRREDVDLAALARHVVTELAAMAQARKIDLGLGDTAAAHVQGDPDALRILLKNVLENAIRYTPEGGKVDVSTGAEGQSVSLRVRDTGPGIPQPELARVFDRFYRVPGTGAEGSGLGLAIVKQIADAHRATVALRNTGSGLLAEITFPAHKPPH
jgi:two-component system, OmpR family, sensor kinase